MIIFIYIHKLPKGVAMSKNMLVFSLFALISGVFAEDKYLDVFLRDFNSNYPGFEEFDTDKGASGQCAGSNPDTPNSFANPANGICFTGNDYVSCDQGGTQLKYGHTDNCGSWATNNGYPKNPPNNKCRWFCNGPDQKGFNCDSWSNLVYVTKGIVQEQLHYDKASCPEEDIMGDEGDPDYLRYRYCARPQKGNGACYGEGVESWFTNGEHTRVYRDMITLKSQGNVYEINHDYNTYVNWRNGEDNGYFPLDQFEDQPDHYGRAPFNAQSIRVWCPSGGNQDPAPDPALCTNWRADGGPRNNVNAARNVANGMGVLNRLHNYSFSMAGSGEFKYVEGANDIFEFIGDDDMWIFIDGKLVADLGGNHLAAPAKININTYGQANGWQNGTKHAINFYYLDRQTDGSNMKLRMSLTDLTPPRFGAPRILKAETTQKQDGTSETTIYVSNRLADNNLEQFIGKSDFPIVVNKVGSNILYGFKLESIVKGPENMGAAGYAYTITGQVCKSMTECGGTLIIGSGDSLSFNVGYDDLKDGNYVVFDGLAFSPGHEEELYIRSAGNNTPATIKSWAVNTTSMPPIIFKPDVSDNDPKKPPFDVDMWFTGDPNGGKNNGGGAFSNGGGSLPTFGNAGGIFPSINQIWDNSQGKLVDLPNGKGNSSVHGFGAKGTPIPPSRTGELILTAYPNAGTSVNGISYTQWDTSSVYQKVFGLPPTPIDGNLYGIADPTVQQPNGGYMFVKNGFKDESSVGGIQVAPTRCIADNNVVGADGSAPRINCLNFSLKAKQPFQIAVTVYDQLGNFVTQYRETVNEQEFRSVVQGPTFIDPIPSTGSESYVYPQGYCRYPTGADDFGKKEIITTNGFVKVNVNIYPFSKDGRRFGNGVYILKIDRVDLPYEGCMNSAGNAVPIEEKYVRYHADTKFGWMRAKP